MNRGGGLLREEASSGVGRACDSCRSAPCAVYCRADAAYLCAGCDARVHAANRVASRHERVWVCEACERAPAALTCRADAASLCAACDADVHSANPLARRHQRVPIPPGRAHLDGVTVLNTDGEENDDDEEAAASWLLLNPVKNSNQGNTGGFLFGGEVDEYLDLGEYNNSATENQNPDQHNLGKHEGTERLVPIEFLVPNEHQNQQEQQQQQQQVFPVEMEYEVSNAGFSYTPISHSVSVSSMEAGVVPDNTTMTDISNSHIRPSKGTIDLFSGPPLQMPTQFTPMDREARVLRYREKRKMRKFEKTIRYASRKAYAETRPRIKGRFAKRSDVELEVDQMFATSVMSEGSYGIVPSF